MLSSLDWARSGEVNASAKTAQTPNEKKWKLVERTQLRQRISFIDSGELELSEPRVCADARKKVKNILLFLQKKTVIKAIGNLGKFPARFFRGAQNTRRGDNWRSHKRKTAEQSSAVQNLGQGYLEARRCNRCLCRRPTDLDRRNPMVARPVALAPEEGEHACSPSKRV